MIGTHADIGGANRCDGLSLYPLQWILSEARNAGLVTGFHQLGSQVYKMENILPKIFPHDDGLEAGPSYKGAMVLENGLAIDMWDIREIHKESGYRVRLNYDTFARWLYSFEPRTPFDSSGDLIGYERTGKHRAEIRS